MGSRNTNLSGKVPHGDLHLLANADYGQIHVEGGKHKKAPNRFAPFVFCSSQLRL